MEERRQVVVTEATGLCICWVEGGRLPGTSVPRSAPVLLLFPHAPCPFPSLLPAFDFCFLPSQECDVTPDSENLTLSSSGAIGQSSCTGTPLSSTISSPEDPGSSSLAQSVMSMVSSQSQHSQVSTDTVSSMSGSYVAPGTEEEGEALPYPRAASRGPSEDGE
ncbi:E3 ubiquitin ligase Rnf157-like, partial [Pteropus vampyrus]|uniref:E3 ubiquitin ligase Rnf157-like n=1 Tax=Pteropus vampyrus TaxID=132908 RepID=A0A6P6C5S6_PTEVA